MSIGKSLNFDIENYVKNYVIRKHKKSNINMLSENILYPNVKFVLMCADNCKYN